MVTRLFYKSAQPVARKLAQIVAGNFCAACRVEEMVGPGFSFCCLLIADNLLPGTELCRIF